MNILIRPEGTEVTVIQGKATLGREGPVSIVYPEQALVSQGKVEQVRKLTREEILDTVAWRKKFDFPELHPESWPEQPQWEGPFLHRHRRPKMPEEKYD